MLQQLIDAAFRSKPTPARSTPDRAQLPHPAGAAAQTPDSGESQPGHAPEGEFVQRTFANAAGERSYWLYVPRGWHAARTRSMVVMLHGCRQSPEDMAAGTRMNELADEHCFIVVYPGQTTAAHALRCWNWYKPDNQRPDAGEPAIIAGITLQAAQAHAVDAQRIYVAGMSAGGSMAAVMGATYPDLYAAVGVHSGVPYRAACNVWSAVLTMKTGRAAGPAWPAWPAWPAAEPVAVDPPVETVPTIVFHGSDDEVVHPPNGVAVVRQARAHEVRHGRGRMRASVSQARMPEGRGFTRTVYTDADGCPLLEHWLVHEAGHTWSGGSAQGSYTDTQGPDASREMIRFFQTFPRSDPSRVDSTELRAWLRRLARRWRRLHH